MFFSAKSGHLILAVNARTAVNPNLVERVEVPYVRNTNSEWRTDFSAISPYSTEISPNLKKARNGHFIEANKKLRNELKNNEDLRTRLNLSDKAMEIVNGTEGISPKPYTWDHVNGQGKMSLVDSWIHGLFLHEGGFSEWHT